MIKISDEEDSDDLLKELFGEPIFTYTTEQAVEDGVLVHTASVGLTKSISPPPSSPKVMRTSKSALTL